jgi:hypothetical protein
VTIVRVGSNSKYAQGWESAFTKGKKSSAKPAAAAKASGKKASAKKKAAGKKKSKK